MTTLDKTTQPQISSLVKVWQRMLVLLKAILMIALVGIVGAIWRLDDRWGHWLSGSFCHILTVP
jgi:hypothetical protein